MSTRISGLRMFARVGACLAVAATAFAADARAQYYLGGEAGWSGLQNQSDRFNVGGAPTVNQRFDDGPAVGVRGGYQWGPWRFEGEYVYRGSDLSGASVGSLTIPGVSGSRNSHAIMANALYDFDLGWPVTPHLGAGIGAANIQESIRAPGIGRVVDDDDWQFAYQAIAGARYNLTPNLALDLDYRYFATTEPSFRLAALPGVRYRTGYDTHNIIASVTWKFAPPPPPPMAAPAVAPAPAPVSRRVFMVFFDWDRDTITPEGMAIVQQAADAYKSGASVQIQVTGYTDRSGSPAYNQRLSERRANNVANALARTGVPRNQMAVGGRGENDNRVPTADGVREPQNRRVEIVFP